jgi:hypothetical protein
MTLYKDFMTTIHDLIGLNVCDVPSLPIVSEPAHITDLLNTQASLSIAGSRHSQGGHTVSSGLPMVLTEALNAVTYNPTDQTITVQAGATWSNIHHILNPLGRSIPVQQSSPYFTIGGSISVNCHGRDPSNSPLSDYILSMEIMGADGVLLTDVRYNGLHAELFKAVVGGYGSCGVVVSATLVTCPNDLLKRQYRYFKTVAQYVAMLDERDASNPRQLPQLHHAMLNFSAPTTALGATIGTAKKGAGTVVGFVDAAVDFLGGLLGRASEQKVLPSPVAVDPDFFVDLFCVDYWSIADIDLPDPMPQAALEPTSWVKNDALNLAWAQARDNDAFRGMTWECLKGYFGVTKVDYRNHWLREDVNFSAQLPNDGTADMLQEYFVPRHRLVEFIDGLKKILDNVTVMNATLRIVRQERLGTHLAYCSTGDMMCLAIDFKAYLRQANLKDGEKAGEPDADVKSWTKAAIQWAIDCGGSYYLPYYSFASLEQFRQAYPSYKKTQEKRTAVGSNQKFKNHFINKYIP